MNTINKSYVTRIFAAHCAALVLLLTSIQSQADILSPARAKAPDCDYSVIFPTIRSLGEGSDLAAAQTYGGAPLHLTFTVASILGSDCRNATHTIKRSSGAFLNPEAIQATLSGVQSSYPGNSTATVTYRGTAPTTPGLYDYQLCVDDARDIHKSNNCSEFLHFQVMPDKHALKIVSKSTQGVVSARDGFLLDVEIKNSGWGRAPRTSIRVSKLTSLGQSGPGQLVGSVNIGSTARKSQRSKTGISVEAPGEGDHHYYRVCVGLNNISDEINPIDNCQSWEQEIVQETDLIFEDFTISGSRTKRAGEAFIAGGWVRNAGTNRSARFRTLIIKSEDNRINLSDTLIGSHPHRPLDPGERVKMAITVRGAESTQYPSTEFYGGCVDVLYGDNNTTNNCSQAEEVSITGDGEAYSDIVIRGVDVLDDGANGSTTLSINARVGNNGLVGTIPSQLHLYQSLNTCSQLRGDRVASQSMGSLNSGDTQLFTFSTGLPTPAGNYCYRVCATPVTGESNRQNNCLSKNITTEVAGISSETITSMIPTVRSIITAQPSIDMIELKADLRIKQMTIVEGLGRQVGEPAVVEITLINEGNGVSMGSSATNRLTLYQSYEQVLEGGWRHDVSFDSVLPGNSSRIRVPFQVQGAFLYACLLNPEKDQNGTQYCHYFTPMSNMQTLDPDAPNGVISNASILVADSPSSIRATGISPVRLEGKANLSIRSLAVSPDDTTATQPTLTFAVELENRGMGASSPSTIKFYQSQAAQVCSTRGRPFFQTEIPSINSFATLTREWSHPADTDGDYCYAACLVTVPGESENNACTTLIPELASEAGPENTTDRPDMTISLLDSADITIKPREQFHLALNIGIAYAGEQRPTRIPPAKLYNSQDEIQSNSDIFLMKTYRGGSVQAWRSEGFETGHSLRDNNWITGPSTVGMHYYYACIPPSEFNTISTNDCTAMKSIQVLSGHEIDVEVTSVRRPFISVIPGTETEGTGIDFHVKNNGYRNSEPATTSATIGCLDNTAIRQYSGTQISSLLKYGELGTGAFFPPNILGEPGDSCWLELCVTPQDNDGDPENNCKKIDYEVGDDNRANVILTPEMDVEVVSVDPSFLNSTGNDGYTVSAVVRNNGLLASEPSASQLSFTCRDEPHSAGSFGTPIESLPAGSTATISADFAGSILGSPGNRCHFMFCIDRQDNETNHDNNCKGLDYEIGDDNGINVIAMQVRSGTLNIGSGDQPSDGQQENQFRKIQPNSTTLKKLTTVKTLPRSRSAFGKRHLEQKAAVLPNKPLPNQEKPELIGPRSFGQSLKGKAPRQITRTTKTPVIQPLDTNKAKLRTPTKPATIGRPKLMLIKKPKKPVSKIPLKAPNLVLGSIIHKGDTRVKRGDKIIVQLTIYNKGQAKAGTSEVKLMRLPNIRARSSNSIITKKTVLAMDKGKSRRYRFRITAPNKPGKMFIGACTKTVANEQKKSDNCSKPLSISVK